MQFFWFGAILLCAALLPVFLAENWCRRHKVKKIFPVPRGMGWLQRTAVWLLCHLPDTISCSRWLTGCSEDIVGKLYPGMKKEKFIRQHVIRKMMVGYGGMLAILAFMMIYGLLNQTPELSGNNLQRDDAGGKSRDVQVSAEIEGVTEEKSLTITVEPRKYSRSEREALMRDVKAYIDACLQGDNSDLQHVNRPLFFPSDFPGENVTIEWQPEDYNLIRQDGSLGELSAYQLPIKTKVTAVIIYDQEKEFYSKEICLTAPEKSDEEVLDEQIREAVQAADQGSSEKLTLHLPDSVGGRPTLVGTTSVEISELLSKMLNMRKIPHQVLNAKLHQKEADIVALAGQSTNGLGAVTIATNMAGRGTDIKLSPEVKAAGGLAIIGTERHESRRVDRQLRGRAVRSP